MLNLAKTWQIQGVPGFLEFWIPGSKNQKLLPKVRKNNTNMLQDLFLFLFNHKAPFSAKQLIERGQPQLRAPSTSAVSSGGAFFKSLPFLEALSLSQAHGLRQGVPLMRGPPDWGFMHLDRGHLDQGGPLPGGHLDGREVSPRPGVHLDPGVPQTGDSP